jgi:GT2 family glycosyltransferase
LIPISNIKVLAIIPSYNGENCINSCLQSLQQSEIDVLVIDNASVNQTKQFIKTNFKNVKLIENTQNLGFGKAINLGFEFGIKNNYTYFLILNQDAELLEDALIKLVNFASTLTSNSWSFISPINLNSEGTKPETYFQDNLLNRSGNHKLQNQEGFKFQTVDFINAACWLVNAASLKLLKGFDERFFMYGEDLNFCHRSKFYKLNMFVLHDAQCIHHKTEGDYESNPLKLIALKKAEMLAYYLNPSLSFLAKTNHFLKINFAAFKLFCLGRFRVCFEKLKVTYLALFKALS